jgi:serine protease Do
MAVKNFGMNFGKGFCKDLGRRVVHAALALSLGLLVAAAPPTDRAYAQGPESVADLADKLIGAVVNISTSQKVDSDRSPVPRPKAPEGSPFQEFFDELFPNRDGEGNGGPETRQSLGSGFVIDPSGIIVTNNHVISDADEVVANFSDGKQLVAEVIGKDSKTDLAVLRVKADQPLPFVKLGNSDTARVGDWVLAIGNPFGFGRTVTLGIVSAIGRDINSGPYDNYIQTDASINKGNSGGPLFNMNGDVIGINTAIISPSGGSIGLGFAIPANLAGNVIDQLVKFGETRRGWLGVQIQTVTDEIAETLGLDKARGALIGDVVAGGPADNAGIKSGDVVLKFDGKDIKEMRELPKVVADTPVDKSVPVVIFRKGAEETLMAVVGRLEDGEKQMAATEDGKETEEAEPQVVDKVFGLSLKEITEEARESEKIGAEIKGVLVAEVEEGSAAADKGIEAGEIIVEVGQEPVANPAEVTQRVDALKKEGRKNALLMVSSKTGDIRFVVLRIE